MIETTVVLVKPDGVAMGFADEICNRYVTAGLEILERRTHQMTENQAQEFYAEHEDRFYFTGLIVATTWGPLEVVIVRGENAVQQVRVLHGPTDPRDAPPGTIRRDFRSAGGPFNTVHGSDSHEAASREYDLVKSW